VTYRLVIDLDGLPKTTNGSHGHWRTAAAERKKWRNAVALIAKMRRPPAPLRAAYVELVRFSSSQPDEDNLMISFKSCVDGLKDGKVLVDDKRDVILRRLCRWEKAKPGEGKIRIIVEEILPTLEATNA
jgi:Holliday junction resolvase RusA-like endonuclease